jgi:hypothetical protein
MDVRKDWSNEDTKGGNKRLLIKGDTIKWSKEKGQNDKQWSTKHYTENKRLENMDPTKKPGVKSEGQASPAPPVTPVMLLIKDTNIMWYENHFGHQCK